MHDIKVDLGYLIGDEKKKQHDNKKPAEITKTNLHLKPFVVVIIIRNAYLRHIWVSDTKQDNSTDFHILQTTMTPCC